MRLTNRRVLAEASFPTRRSRFWLALCSLNPNEALEFTVTSDREYRAMHAGFTHAARAHGVEIAMRKRDTSFFVALAEGQPKIELEIDDEDEDE
jgi:hypothetical protein